ncbi:MAG: ferrous iron transport protein B, partial [Hymenobacter sp.]
RIVLAERLAVAPTRRFWEIPAGLQPLVQDIRAHFGLHNDYLALHYAHQFQQLHFLSETDRAYLAQLTEKAGFDATARQAEETVARYAHLNELLLDAVTVTRTEEQEPVSNRIDKVLTHRVFGYLIFLALLFLLFQAIFAWAQYPMDLIDQGVAGLNQLIQRHFHGPLVRLLTEGVIAGLGGVLIFIPQIALLFAFLAVLEESGYMARVTFLMDKLMRPFGLSGKSVVPLISGLACAVPAIMGARTIESWKDRMLTIFVTPLMSCSARIPVYTVLVALVVPDESWLGVFNLRGLVLMGLYLLGTVSALLSAWALKVLLKARERSYFIMEFPVYRWPRWKNVGLTIVEKVKAFVWQAGKVIVAISVLLWVLASYGPGNRQEEAAARVVAQQKTGFYYVLAHPEAQESINRQQAAARLENSYAGTFGHFIEPVIRPLGFDWKIGIALLTSFAAREVFVGTMSTIYSVGQDADLGTVREKLAGERDAQGHPFFTPKRALSLLVFYVFAMQCMSTLATTYRETKSWRWPLGQLVYMTGLAYLASLLVWQIF